MQQITKTYQPFKWMVALMTATTLFLGCGSGETKTEEVSADTTSATVAPADSSTLDTASTRPEVRKN